jgi:30S ribosomal protein S31
MMGKGDSRSRRGKIYQGSFGKTRPKDPTKGKKPVVAAKAKSTTAKKKS